MRIACLFLILCLLYGHPGKVCAQPLSREHSLSLSTIDTSGIDSMLNHGAQLLFRLPPDSTEPIFRHALQLSIGQSYMNGIVTAYGNLGLCLARKRAFKESVSCLQKAIGFSRFTNKEKRLKLLYTHLASVYQLMGAFPQTIQLVSEMLPQYNLNDSLERLYYLTLKDKRSGAYLSTGNPLLAFMDLHDIILAVKQPDSITSGILAGAYNRISMIASQMHQYEYALKMTNAVEKLAARFSDQYLLSHALATKASIYYNTGELDKSLAYAMKSLATYEDSYDILPHKASVLTTIAGTLAQKGDYHQALIYAQEALRLDLKLKEGHNGSLAKTYTMLGNIYGLLNNYPLAKEALLQAEKATNVQPFKLQQIQIYKLLAEIYKQEGDYSSAFTYKERYYALKDSMASDDMKIRMTDAEARYNLADKDRLIAITSLESERLRNRQYLWIGVSLLMLLTLTGSILYMKNRSELLRIKSILDGEEQERKRIGRELHDGVVSQLSIAKTNFSNLKNLPGEKEQMFTDALHQLDQGIAELRSTSHNLMPTGLSHEGLIATLEYYFQQINASGKIKITLQVVDVLPPLTDSFQLNLYRIIQELVQNILKYAGASQILIQFNVYADTLTVTIEDNGHGRTFDENNSTPGIGLSNLAARLQLLSGEREVESDPTRGTTVYLTFPTGGL